MSEGTSDVRSQPTHEMTSDAMCFWLRMTRAAPGGHRSFI